MERLNWIRIFSHMSFWVVYLMLNAALTCIIQGMPLPNSMPTALLVEACVLPVKIALTYFVFYYIIPLYLDRDKVYKLVGLLLPAFTIAILIYRLILVYVFSPTFKPDKQIQIFFAPGMYLTSFDLFITLAAATTVKMIRMHYKSIEFEQQLLREKLQSELNFLQAQTNPHFLFNTLNNLYVLARKKSDRTPDAIMMLSQIMRFVLYDCRAPRIRIADEAKVIQDYIELEKMRYNERLTVRYLEEMDNPRAQIAPLLLLPLVENSFKHGANSTTGRAEIIIHLQLKDQQLFFFVDNTDENPPEQEHRNGGGIGLKNIRRQLELIYPDQYRLDLKKANGRFIANLEIRLEA
jgi:two-component system LytT family sensor kinase